MITDLLLDVNVVIDICAGRSPYRRDSLKALDKALREKVRLWLYTGCVQTLEYVLAGEIRRASRDKLQPEIGADESHSLAKALLRIFSRDKQWLAALAENDAIWSAEDPEDRQLCNAVFRLGENARLLTRDENLAKQFSQAVTPRDYQDMVPEKTVMPFIDLSGQQDRIRPALENRIHSVLRHGQYILGPEVKELEQKLAAYVGTKHAIGCASGTDALLMALMAYDVGPGDAIFTTPFTFIATAEVISLLGATPVFVDIDPLTYNIDPSKLELAFSALINRDKSIYPLPDSLNIALSALRPRGVIAVDLFGLPADYDSINSISKKFNLFVIEDAAQSFGAEYRGEKACSLADLACTSFFPAKPLGGYGDGGMCFTGDDHLAETLRSIRVHGEGIHKYDNVRVGFNGRLDSFQAAILLAKFDIFPEEVALRQEVARRYTALLTPDSSLHPPHIPEGCQSVWAQYSILAENEDHRTLIQKKLQDNKFPTAIYYPTPLHLQTAFTSLGYAPGAFPVSENTSNRIFSIPMHPYLDEKSQAAVVNAMSPTR
jgi:dTDP-4-amino-4,6-dideoxygalactose transaminase/predicted nucleic acid-binding protein